MENNTNKFLYKFAVYNDNDRNLYKLSGFNEKINADINFIKKFYFNKKNNIFTKIFKNDTITVYDNLVLGLIEYHKRLGNDNYVEKLSNTIFHNNLVMIIDDYSNKNVNQFPWNFNTGIYNIFLINEMCIFPQLIFTTKEQLENKNSECSKVEYDLFYQDVLDFLNICAECATECERHKSYNKLLESEENQIDYKWPESIKIHLGNNKDIDIIDLSQVQDYIENTMYDNNYYNDHEKIQVKDSSLIFQRKRGATYIGDPNSGVIDVYVSDPGSYKYNS